MSEVAHQTQEGLFLTEVPSETQGRRFRIENLQIGLPLEAIDAVRERRVHFIHLLDPKKDVGINVKCELVEDQIHVSQSNLDRDYTFDGTNGAFIE